MREIDPVITASSKNLPPIQPAQARRILPDLRTIEIAVAQPAAPLRVTSTPRKKGGNIMLHDTEKMVEHQEGTSPTTRDSEPAQVIHIEASSLAISEDDHDIRLSRSGAETTTPQKANSSTPRTMPEFVIQPSRRWARETVERPRWEKWKRRLPQVCR